MWKGKNDRRKDIPDSIDATLTEQIDSGAYVNIYTTLQIPITIPISLASCERSTSTSRNLKTYLRNTMVHDHRLAVRVRALAGDTVVFFGKTLNSHSASLHPEV